MALTPTGMLDYSKFIMHSDCAAFANVNQYLGSFNIAQTFSTNGVLVTTRTVVLPTAPVLCDVFVRGGNVDPFGDNPNNPNQWMFATLDGYENSLYINGTGVSLPDAGNSYFVTYYIQGNVITFTIVSIWQYIDTVTISSTPIYYKIVDYTST